MPRPAAISGYFFAFLLLSALTWTVWQYRFAPPPDTPALTLNHTPKEVMRVASGKLEEEGSELHFRAKADGVVQQLEYRWSAHPSAKYAHIAIEASCQDVHAGKMPWEDARIVLLWIDANGKMAQDWLPIWAGRGDKERSLHDMVVPLARSGTLPKIGFENAGRSGVFTVHSFTVQPVEYRAGMHWIIAGLTLAWFGWAALGMRRWFSEPGTGFVRIAAAAALWVFFAWQSSLPGPWIPFQPIKAPFPIPTILPPAKPVTPPAAVTAPPLVAVAPPAAPQVPPPIAATQPPPVMAAAEPSPDAAVPPPQPRPSAEEGKPEGISGPIRRILNKMPALKRLGHLVAFAAISGMLALFLGCRRAMWPAFALGALTEFCQWAFGFGFESGDVLDLMCDAAAVLAGIALWKMTSGWWKKRPPAVAEGLQSPAANT